MRIDRPQAANTQAAGQAQPKPQANAQARQAADSLSLGQAPIKVVTFNTGIDDDMQAPQEPFVNLPMFQDVIQGKPDAPIIACQEAGDKLSKKLLEEAKRTGNFQVVWTGHKWLPSDNKLLSSMLPGTFVLVPKRFQVLSSKTHYYKGRIRQTLADLWGVIRHKKTMNDVMTDQGRRGYQELKLKDTRTGKPFTMINTHISYYAPVRQRQAEQLAAAVKKAEGKGPVLVTGDFNTPTRDTNTQQDPAVEKFWKTLDPAGLMDMGPRGKDGISDWKSSKDIDHVLAKGFTAIDSHMYKGNELPGVPGRPDAKDLSDHYAEGDTIAFEG